jgi:hydrogenase maturation protease
MQKNILILGLGNILLKDEGIGVRVAEKLMDASLPPDVEVMDGGTAGLNLLYVIEGRHKVIVIDAVKAGSPPGTMYRFTDKDLTEKQGLLRSAHGVDFSDVLRTALFLGTKPDLVIFIGIEPEDLSDGLELSPLIESRIPYLIKLVMKELESG